MEINDIFQKIKDILLIIIILIMSFLIFKITKLKDELDYYKNLDYKDSIQINIKYRDSIIYNIQHRDSIIYNIKQGMQDENEKIYSLDDSSTIDLFYKLATGD